MRPLLTLLASLLLVAVLPAQGSKPTQKPQDPKPVQKPAKEKQREEAKEKQRRKEEGEVGPRKETPKDKTEKPVVEEDETENELPEDLPLPAGADPADLRAMKSARDMLLAERRLRKLIRDGDLEGVDRLVTFEELSSWPYEDGLKGMPKAIKELDGKNVAMVGFMLPIDEVENIREFLLVQSLWACCFGTPPDINGLVRVVMKGKTRVDYQFDPILVQGTLKVEAAREDGYCIDIFQLHADSVKLVEDARRKKPSREKKTKTSAAKR